MNEFGADFGKLMLPTEPGTAEAALGGVNAAETVFMVVFVVLAILFLKNFINILPYVLGSVTRPRMSSEIEGSIRMTRDRNFVAATFVIPFCLILNRYDIYSPAFLDAFGPGTRLLIVTAIFVAYLLVRLLIALLLKAARMRPNVYSASRRICYTMFIVAMVFMLLTLGPLVLFHTPTRAIRVVLIAEMALSYLILLARRAQILSPYCNPFSLFLYLCALELLPTGLYIASALVF
ncbi:MAG: DUF4271 domain-containing protein [Bacteroidales bacterium]|nr:DUF4271 domain-containing protein [Bacteroidales bacterium]